MSSDTKWKMDGMYAYALSMGLRAFVWEEAHFGQVAGPALGGPLDVTRVRAAVGNRPAWVT